MKDLISKMKAVWGERIILQQITELNDEALKEPKFASLAKLYSEFSRDPHQKVIVSFINAALTQNRSSFAIDRRSAHCVAAADTNWKKLRNEPPGGFRNENWKLIVKYLATIGRVHIPDRRKPMVVEITAPDLLPFFTADRNVQLEEAIRFVSKKASRDQGGDQVDSSESNLVRREGPEPLLADIEEGTTNATRSKRDRNTKSRNEVIRSNCSVKSKSENPHSKCIHCRQTYYPPSRYKVCSQECYDAEIAALAARHAARKK